MAFLFALYGMLASPAWAADGASQLNKVGFFALPGNDVQISLDFSGNPPQPLSFTTDNPARIVLDFPGTHLNIPERFQNVGIGAVTAINAVEAGGRTRVVVELVRSVPFGLREAQNQLSLSIGSAGEGRSLEPPVSTAGAAPSTLRVSSAGVAPSRRAESVPSAMPGMEPYIQSIDFRRAENGAGRIIISLSDPGIGIDMREEGEDIVVDFQDVRLPEKLDRRLDVNDFATPVTSIDTTRSGKGARMRIKSAGRKEHQAYQVGNVYTVEVKQYIQDTKDISIAEKVYTGERLSLNFQNIDIHAVLNLIADFKGFNIVTTDAVKGTVTLRLKNVPWDQALDLILDSKALGMRQIGNVLSIDLKANIDARKQQELKAQEEIRQLEPLRTEYIQINYAKADAMKTLLTERGGGSGEVGHSFLSGRGSASVDERTNTLIIQDTAERLADVRKLIMSLDKPARQVLIESRVVIASDEFTKDLGVKFGHSTNNRFGNASGDHGWGIVTGGKLPGDTQFPVPVSFNQGNENFVVDLPAAGVGGGSGAAFGLAIGKVGTYLLQLELNALQREGRGEIVSSPRIITANQKKATIKQGIEVAVPGTAGVGAVAAPTFKEAVLQLEVTPQITPDDRVIMDLKVNKDSERATGGTFAMDKREVETQVLVDNGETVVLGGVYEQTKTNAVDRVPFFGDLPVVGALFRRTSDVDSKRELLIFVTPKILKEKAALASR